MSRGLVIRATVALSLAAGPIGAGAARSSAQELAMDVRGPRFLATGATPGTVVDASRAAVLRRRVALELDGATMAEALRSLTREAKLNLLYTASVVPVHRRITLSARDITVAAALTEILLDAGVDVSVSRQGQLALVPRRSVLRIDAVGVMTGQVTDAATGQGIAGAEVRLAGTRIATAANDSGQYVLREVPAGEQRVTARRIGYQAQTKTVTVPEGGSATLDFALGAIATRLDELVTTVTGDQRRLEVGNVITTIRADSAMLTAPIRTFQDLLASRAPGVQIMNADGVSGTSNVIRVRGINSATVSNDPLIVIDGVRAQNTAQATSVNSTVAANILTTGRINDLKPEEIESIEVVKGPSAATLYGTDAANGVIVVTTKHGRAGKAQWTASAERGLLTNATRFPDSYYAFGTNATTGALVRCTNLNRVAGICTLDSLSRFSPLNDPSLTPIGSGFRHDVNLQVSGGTGALRYFVAGGYEEETGYLRMPDVDQEIVRQARGITEVPEDEIRPNALSKISLRGNFMMGAGTKADLTLSAGFVSGDTRLPSGGGGNQVVTFGISGPGYRDASGGWLAGFRPAQTFAARNREAVNRFTGSLAGSWRPTSWLTARATGGVDNSSALTDYLVRTGVTIVKPSGARLNSRANALLSSVDLGSSANLRLTEAITSRTSIGAQYNRRDLSMTTAQAAGLPVGSETVTGAVTNQSVESTVQTVVAGTYLEQMFGWRDRLFVTGAVRFDGGSSFGSDFKTAVYPKASVSWVAFGVGGERRGPLSLLRVRGAYGQSGVQPDPIAALARYELFTTIGGNGAALVGFGNPLLKPERQVEFEAGIDAELWHGRVGIEATAYQRRSRDALINRPLGPSLGVATVQENIGSVRNRGLEGAVHVRALESRAVTLDLGVNGFVNQNLLLTLGAGIQPIGGVGVGQQGSRQRPGYPLYGQWWRPILGYSDANGNGILEPAEVQVGDTSVYVGARTPTRQLTGSLTIGVFNEQLSLSGLVDYRGGHVLLNGAESQNCQLFALVCRAHNDPTAPLADQAAMVAQAFHSQASAGYIADASYLQLREIALTYVVSPRLLTWLRARSATLTLGARNLGTITSFSGIHPEALLQSGSRGDEPFTNPVIPPATYWIARLTVGL